jgi:hypothetical protein
MSRKQSLSTTQMNEVREYMRLLAAAMLEHRHEVSPSPPFARRCSYVALRPEIRRLLSQPQGHRPQLGQSLLEIRCLEIPQAAAARAPSSHPLV